jgi:hypothetical protein
VTGSTIILLIGEVAKPAWVFVLALLLLVLGNSFFKHPVISMDDAFEGFGNPDVVAIGLLYIISNGVKESTALRYLAKYVLGRPKSTREALARLCIPVVCISAIMNNTPIVAMLIPAVEQWASDCRLESSKLLMPLSFSAILGGVWQWYFIADTIVPFSLVKPARARVCVCVCVRVCMCVCISRGVNVLFCRP